MAKGGVTISKIVEEIKRPRGTVATILRKYRLRGSVFQTAKRIVVDLQKQQQETVTYNMGLHVL